MRQKGIPTYTRHTLAFPNVPLHSESGAVYEEIGVSFDAKGGGTLGEFTFEFYRFKTDAGKSHVALRCFQDGMKSLADERIQDLLRVLRLDHGRDTTPEKVEDWLRAAGVRPSIYHLRGEIADGASLTRRHDIDREIARLRRHEHAA